MGTDTAWASRYTENSQGNCEKPPRSATMDGTAVATIVESSATSDVASISDAKIGPRSERRPTAAVTVASPFLIRNLTQANRPLWIALPVGRQPAVPVGGRPSSAV